MVRHGETLVDAQFAGMLETTKINHTHIAHPTHLLNAWDVVDIQALQGALELLVIHGGSLVDGLDLPPDSALAADTALQIERRRPQKWNKHESRAEGV